MNATMPSVIRAVPAVDNANSVKIRGLERR
jgi:hypothetical protein